MPSCANGAVTTGQSSEKKKCWEERKNRILGHQFASQARRALN